MYALPGTISSREQSTAPTEPDSITSGSAHVPPQAGHCEGEGRGTGATDYDSPSAHFAGMWETTCIPPVSRFDSGTALGVQSNTQQPARRSPLPGIHVQLQMHW